MTLDEAIALARTHEPDGKLLARYLLEIFGEAQPCGQISPEVYPGEVIITREMVGIYSPAEALAIAADIVRGAEEAQGAKV